MWLIWTGLSDPHTATRCLADFCRDFRCVEMSTISHSSVAAARDCFCELIKRAPGSAVAKATEVLPAGSDDSSQPILLAHIHDEASLRLRSFDSALGERIIIIIIIPTMFSRSP